MGSVVHTTLEITKKNDLLALLTKSYSSGVNSNTYTYLFILNGTMRNFPMAGEFPHGKFIAESTHICIVSHPHQHASHTHTIIYASSHIHISYSGI